MGSDDLFKKRRADRKRRRHEFKTPRANSYLIVTEGERTEPYYFKGIQEQIMAKVGGRIDIVEAPLIEISGEGCSTGKLIEIAERIVKDAKIMYQNVWVVFDKDHFPDFDEAVMAGKRRGYGVAWSNQSFEYWLYLHFAYSDSALHRDGWSEKLDEIFGRYMLGDGKYHKNYENIYALADTFHGVETAIKLAKRRMAGYHEETDKPSAYDPGTTVYLLVEELRRFL